MKLYNLSITKILKNGCRVANDWRNLTMVQAQGYLASVVSDPTLADFTITMSCSDTGKHPKPFAKTKAGQRRRAERNFTAQGAYDDLWGPPLEDPMGWEQ